MTETEISKKDRFKFRVWDNTEKEYVDSICFRLTPSGVLVFTERNEPEANLKRFIVEQCTGLIAKNGKLIYEGDILSDGDDFGYVFFNKSNGCLAINNFLWQKKPKDLLIVGNVHENYKLIGGVE